jgi:hypothetical protein
VRAVLVAAIWLVALGGARGAAAQTLVDDGFNVDLYQGPILGSSRVIGLGGAYAALAEEAVGIQFNPASVAHRTWYSRGRWDWDLTADWLLPNIARSKEFSLDNSGLPADTTSFYVINAGGLLQYKGFGIGFAANLQRFVRAFPDPAGDITFGFDTYHLSAGYGFFRHQLLVAGGVRIGALNATSAENKKLFDLTATGGEVGVLVRPERLPLRFGAAFYSALQQPKRITDPAFPSLAMPHSVALPWQVTAGVAWQLSRWPLNPAPDFRPPPRPRRGAAAGATPPASAPGEGPPEDEGVAARRRQGMTYLLLSLDVQVAAPVDDAVGIASFLSGQRETSGAGYSWSVRFGAEAEVWRRRLRLRAGTYWEPSRFAESSGRIHGTFGLDVRLFDFRLWGPRALRTGLVGDFARNYTNAGISLGLWH